MSPRPVLVLKLGSSVLGTLVDLPGAALRVARHVREGSRVVAVVSALARETDALLHEARRVSPAPEALALAALLATGERRSAALFTIALHDAGVPAVLLDPVSIDLRARGPHLDADPCGVDPAAVSGALHERPAAVLPGFFGRGDDGQVALFGRGGSDLSALVLANALGARCLLLKDVDGVFDRDPRCADARLYQELSWDDALALGGRVVQAKALRFARERGLLFEVGETLVGPGPSRLSPSERRCA